MATKKKSAKPKPGTIQPSPDSSLQAWERGECIKLAKDESK